MITEIWLGVPVTAGGKEQIQRLDEGYELQPHGRGASHQRYVMAHRPGQLPLRPDFSRACATVFGLPHHELIGPSQLDVLVRARYAGIWAARKYGLTYSVIGRMFRRHHATCIAGVKKARIWRWQCEEFRSKSDSCLSVNYDLDITAAPS